MNPTMDGRPDIRVRPSIRSPERASLASQSSVSGVLRRATFTKGAGDLISLSPGYGRFQSVAEYQITWFRKFSSTESALLILPFITLFDACNQAFSMRVLLIAKLAVPVPAMRPLGSTLSAV